MMDILYWVWANLPWIILAVVAHLAILGTVAYLILLERKTASWVQDRIGPNRVGLDFGILPFKFLKNVNGLGQPLADGLKFIMKEDYRPKHVDKILFTIAPGIMIVVIIISIAVLPWGGWKLVEDRRVVLAEGVNRTNVVLSDADRDAKLRLHIPATAEVLALHEHPEPVEEARPGDVPRYKYVVDVTYRYPFQIANLNIGVLFVLAVLSLAVYGVVIGGWASNNKYSFLGGLRATANMISYEIPLGLAVLCVVLMFGTLDMNQIVAAQTHYWLGFIPAWNVFAQPLAFTLFLICIHAEANRAPFDTAEAEQELVGGYHTEYSAMRFALFFLAEYAGMITTSAVMVALFLGGWHLPWVEHLWPALKGTTTVAADGTILNQTDSIIACIARAFIFFGKTMAIIFVFMWVRWSLPRFRFDQIMMLAWRALIPISLALVMVTAVVIYWARDVERPLPRTDGAPGVLLSGWEALLLLIASVALTVLTMLLSRMVPAAPDTNRKINVPNSRYARTPLPGTPVGALTLNKAAAAKLPVEPMPVVSGRAGA